MFLLCNRPYFYIISVKVGGMRVVQHKKESEKVDGAPMTTEEEAEFGSG